MKQFLNWIKEYSLLIISCLILVIMIKGCSSNRKYEYMSNKYEYTITTMTNTIDSCNFNTRCLCDTIYNLRQENALIKDMLKDAKSDKEYYRKVNNNLVNVTNNLSYKNDTIN
jgi:hypothetical protein